ncbi:MAG TPA: HAMP domain-containing sensor histidine kinase [Solirubrobacterales bacterium]|nr:HAMP domain-containing sensor histidine kinase [Solirubrobacterales bacterium]
MAVELAEVAAGLPVAASFALVGGITSLREGRRRSALNEVMHELRRPLQVLTLALPQSQSGNQAIRSSLRLAVDALDQLDREINGGRAEAVFSPVRVGPLVEAAAERGGSQARLAGRQLRTRLGAGDPWVEGSSFELAQAVDNLITNAVEHGDGEVTVEVDRGSRSVSIRVCDEGRLPGSFGWRRHRLPGRGHRHGHGLRVVRRIAASHGGSFRLTRSADRTVADLRLPLRLEGPR